MHFAGDEERDEGGEAAACAGEAARGCGGVHQAPRGLARPGGLAGAEPRDGNRDGRGGAAGGGAGRANGQRRAAGEVDSFTPF